MTSTTIICEDFTPPAAATVAALPESLLFHQKHGFRHPLGIYSISLSQILEDFNHVLREHSTAVGRIRAGELPQATDIFDAVLSAQRVLIHSLREHIEDCHLVLMCLINPDGVNVAQPGAANFLRAAKCQELSLLIQPLRKYLDDYLLPLVNLLKHSQGRLRACAFVGGSDIRVGFYVEEVDQTGVAGPSATLHNGNTAFSFARDLRLNLLHVYIASFALEAAVSAVAKRSRVELVPTAAEGKSSIAWRGLLAEVGGMAKAVFPQELTLGFPSIREMSSGDFELEYPAWNAGLTFPEGARVMMATKGDGVTRSFRSPYYHT